MGDNISINTPLKTKVYIIQAIGTRKDGTYLIPHCLFELLVLSPLKYGQVSYTSVPFFKKSNPQNRETSIDKKNRNCGQL